MFKSLIGRISRWVRRKSDRYCTIELNKDARGLAKCLVPGPLTKKEKASKYFDSIRNRLIIEEAYYTNELNIFPIKEYK